MEYTRLPGIEKWLGERRVEEWRRANHIRDNLKALIIEPPVYPNAPEAAGGML